MKVSADLFATIERLGEVTIHAVGDQRAPLSGEPCAYWEWAAGRHSESGWSMVSARRSSPEEVEVEAGGLRQRMPMSSILLYLRPSLERRVASLSDAPVVIDLSALDADEFPVSVIEYRLQAGAKYHARVETVPSAVPSGARSERRRVLHLSDAPFSEQANPPLPSALDRSL